MLMYNRVPVLIKCGDLYLAWWAEKKLDKPETYLYLYRGILAGDKEDKIDE